MIFKLNLVFSTEKKILHCRIAVVLKLEAILRVKSCFWLQAHRNKQGLVSAIFWDFNSFFWNLYDKRLKKLVFYVPAIFRIIPVPWIESWALFGCVMYELLYLTFTEHFCQVISRDQPSVIGTGALSVDPVAFLCFIPKDKTFLLVTYAFRSTCWLTKKEKLLYL